MPPELHFLRPAWFLALLPLALMLVLLWRSRGRDQTWRGLVDAHLLPHLLVGAESGPRRTPVILLALAWLIGVTALAGPVWQRLPQPVYTTSEARVILLDLSPSMNAADVRPSRLARARFEVLDLLAASEEGQVGLIAYGPEPFLVSPLTTDARTIAAQVPRLATDLIPAPGPRNLARALEMAGDLLAQAAVGGGQVIVVTDGAGAGAGGGGPEGMAFGALEIARGLSGRGAQVSVLGLGTEDGAPIPDTLGGFVDDGRGGIRISRLEEDALRELAQAGGGRYVGLDAGDADTRALLDGGVLPEPRELVLQEGLAADQWREEGPWLLLVLLPLAALAFRRGWLLPAVLAVALLPTDPALALTWDELWQRPDQRAASHFERGNHAAAAAAFRDPDWRAAAQYHAGDYARALETLEGREGAQVDYNRGNALARLGRLDAAIAAYQRTLEVQPDHADARANLDLLRRLKAQQQAQASQPRDTGGQTGQGGSGDPSASGNGGSQGHPAGEDGSGHAGAGEGQDAGGGGESAGDGEGAGSDARVDSGGSGGTGGSRGGADPGRDGDGGSGSGGSEGSGPDGGGDADPGASGVAALDAAGAGSTGQADPHAEARDGARAGRGGTLGETAEPGAEDLGPGAISGEPEAPLEDAGSVGGLGAGDGVGAGVAGENGRGAASAGSVAIGPAGLDDLTPGEREARQALEAQLRRVPDDPAGLLRQRFLLQHLRRQGRLQ